MTDEPQVSQPWQGAKATGTADQFTDSSVVPLITVQGDFNIRLPCGAPAPLVLNGGHYAGCSLAKYHDGHHRFTVEWENGPGAPLR